MTRLKWIVFGVAALVVLFGPLVAPYSPTATVGPPFAPPAAASLFGTDQLGRDVLSRLLHGGLPMLVTSALAALIGSGAGAAVGLFTALAAPRRRWAEAVFVRPLDLLAAVPPILVLLLVLTAMPNRAGIVLAVTLATVPLSARITRAAADQVVCRAHVEVAVARGEGWAWLLGREVLPLVAGTVLADVGIRFVTAVYLVAAAGFLGLGTSASDWGLLIAEALPGAVLQPWALLSPVAGVALVAVTANLASDTLIRRSRGVLG